MKKIILFFVFSIQLNSANAQAWCDSTFVFCDSISIDSVWITHHPINGDRIQVQFINEHEFLHGPYFIICPASDSIAFLNDTFGWFGLVGSNTFLMYYQFQNFNFSGDTLIGNLVVNNFANPFPHCILPFIIPLNDTSTSIKGKDGAHGLEVYPNPAGDYLIVNLKNNTNQLGIIQLYDLKGKEQLISRQGSILDVNTVPAGLYILKVVFYNGEVITKKVIIK